MLLDLLSSGPVSITQAALRLQVKEKVIEQVVDVLMVVGRVTIANGLVTSIPSLPPSSPLSPKSPPSSSDDSYGPIPETPPQSMPMWDSSQTDVEPLPSYPGHSSSVRKVQRRDEVVRRDQPVLLPSIYQPSTSRSMFPLSGSVSHNPPPPTQPVRPPRSDRVWASTIDVGSLTSLHLDKLNKSILSEMSFDSNLDVSDSSVVDFFQSSFWDQY